ncbi:DUF2058 domain-containing protein [Motilimonas cestriensis]|uniref:DUF2058 domain-containing protein n=1 Tax=Motilimonas cestriensis TaxID=2742685 RepID=A0ABS8W733_9GAMM|nr:DUF2058 domain-containing protein [Motilimonas cestriensis]MCE2594804.1 DUF2058 domain-containing protein [Motilimonas cestriensis]
MSSLADQLLKSGLVSKQAARSAQAEKRKQNKQKKKKGTIEKTEVQLEVEKAAQEQKLKDEALNEQKRVAAAAKEQQERVKQIILRNALKDIEGEIEYKFTFANVIKKLWVTPKLQQDLVKGLLAVVTVDDRFYIVLDQVAQRLNTIDETAVVLLHEKSEATQAQIDEEVDDPYAGYEIPDDLMW